jgi:hypothetical protein
MISGQMSVSAEAQMILLVRFCCPKSKLNNRPPVPKMLQCYPEDIQDSRRLIFYLHDELHF